MLILSGIAEMFGKAAKEQFVGLATAAVLTTGLAFTPSANAQEIDTTHATTTHLNEMDTSRVQFANAVSAQLPEEFDASTARTYAGPRQIQVSATDNSGRTQNSNITFENGATTSTFVGPGADGKLTRYGMIWEGSPDDPSSLKLGLKLDLKDPQSRELFTQIDSKLASDYTVPSMNNTVTPDPRSNNVTARQVNNTTSTTQQYNQSAQVTAPGGQLEGPVFQTRSGPRLVETVPGNPMEYTGRIFGSRNGQVYKAEEYDLSDRRGLQQFQRKFNQYEREDGNFSRQLSREAEREMRNQKNPIEQSTDTMRDLNQLGNQVNRGLNTINRVLKGLERF